MAETETKASLNKDPSKPTPCLLVLFCTVVLGCWCFLAEMAFWESFFEVNPSKLTAQAEGSSTAGFVEDAVKFGGPPPGAEKHPDTERCFLKPHIRMGTQPCLRKGPCSSRLSGPVWCPWVWVELEGLAVCRRLSELPANGAGPP